MFTWQELLMVVQKTDNRAVSTVVVCSWGQWVEGRNQGSCGRKRWLGWL